ncbi:MAG: SpoIIE family protein phosphatase [bacterium]|nr:SpoIIE family protein phosphatase [bacterium]
MSVRPEQAHDHSSTAMWILKIAQDLARPFPLNRMLEEVVRVACAALRADRTTIWLHDDETSEFYTEVAIGIDPIRIPSDRGLVGACGSSREVINVPDCQSDPRFNPTVDRETGYRSRCLLSVPLIGYDDSLIGVMQVLNRHEGHFDDADIETATALSAHCAVALQRAQMLEELLVKRRLEHELAAARQIQRGTLPQEMPKIEGYEIFGWNKPAEETGGDTYDIHQKDEHLFSLLLADATGHGIGPAISVTQVRSMLRMCDLMGCPLEEAFEGVNRQLVADLPSDRFVTVFLGQLDTHLHRVRYLSGGQGPVLHYRADTDKVEFLDSTTMPLGILKDLPGSGPRNIDLQPGDIVALITDGLVEAAREDGEQFGDERTAACLREYGHHPMSELARILHEQVLEFNHHARQDDDITVLLVKRQPGYATKADGIGT